MNLEASKGGIAHEEDDKGRNTEEAFNSFFKSIKIINIEDNNWMVDIGLKIHDLNHMVDWSKSSHRAMLQYLLPSLSAE